MAKKYYDSFNFTGDLSLPKEGAKVPLLTEINGKNNWKGYKINFGVRDDSGSSQYVELMGSVQKEIYAFDKEKNKISIPWSDRLSQESLDMCADWVKYTADLGFGAEEFLSEYDMVHYLVDKLPLVTQPVKIRGSFEASPYKGKVYKKFSIQSIELADPSADKKLVGMVKVFYDADGLDKARFKTEQKLDIACATRYYDRATKSIKYAPFDLCADFSKADATSDSYKKNVEYVVGLFSARGKDVKSLYCGVSFVNGAEQSSITIDDLDAGQRMQMEMFGKTLEEMSRELGGTVVGDRVIENRITTIHADFAEAELCDELTPEDLILETAVEEVAVTDIVETAESIVDTDGLFD